MLSQHSFHYYFVAVWPCFAFCPLCHGHSSKLRSQGTSADASAVVCIILSNCNHSIRIALVISDYETAPMFSLADNTHLIPKPVPPLPKRHEEAHLVLPHSRALSQFIQICSDPHQRFGSRGWTVLYCDLQDGLLHCIQRIFTTHLKSHINHNIMTGSPMKVLSLILGCVCVCARACV